MKSLSIVFKRDLTIEWANLDQETTLDIVGSQIQDIFDRDREFIALMRWVLSGEEALWTCKLKLANSTEATTVEVRKSGEFFLLNSSLNPSSDFSKTFQQVFSQTFPGGLLYLSSDFKVIEISHKLLVMLEVKNKDNIALSKKSLLEQEVDKLFLGSKKENLTRLIKDQCNMVKDSREINIIESFYKDRLLKIMLGPVYEGNTHIGSCIYFFDITEEDKKNKLIKEQEVMLFQSSKLASLGEMAGGIAHEINNPLAILSGNISVMQKGLKKGLLTEELLAESLGEMKTTVDRMAKIVQGMRIISRESATEKMDTCPPLDILEDVLAVSCEKCKNHGIKLTVNVPDNFKNITVKCRRIQISQVLLNLLNNAIDAVKPQEKPHITIDIKISNNNLQFLVTDNGDGIPTEIVEKVFQPFFTTKEVGKGTGLGLSLSSKIIREHSSELKYFRHDERTSFSFELSLAK